MLGQFRFCDVQSNQLNLQGCSESMCVHVCAALRISYE
jgi:hypothetical protein